MTPIELIAGKVGVLLKKSFKDLICMLSIKATLGRIKRNLHPLKFGFLLPMNQKQILAHSG
jgi:hypothetical protein